MATLKDVIGKLVAFRNERDWKQFHNPKDLSLAVSIEASELNELFLWKESNEVDINKVKEEVADILSFTLLLCDHYGFDPIQVVEEKIRLNEMKYPVALAKGTAKKYNEL